MTTITDLKKLVIQDRPSGRDKYGRPHLYVVEHEGEMFATNSYWLMPARALGRLLEHFDFSPLEQGAYEVNGKVERVEDFTLPNLASIMPKVDGYHVMTRDTIRGRGAYIRDERGHHLAMFTRESAGLNGRDGEDHHETAVRGDVLDFVLESGDPTGRNYDRYVYRQRTPGTSPLVIHERPGEPFTSPETFVGLIMPVRL